MQVPTRSFLLPWLLLILDEIRRRRANRRDPAEHHPDKVSAKEMLLDRNGEERVGGSGADDADYRRGHLGEAVEGAEEFGAGGGVVGHEEVAH